MISPVNTRMMEVANTIISRRFYHMFHLGEYNWTIFTNKDIFLKTTTGSLMSIEEAFMHCFARVCCISFGPGSTAAPPAHPARRTLPIFSNSRSTAKRTLCY